MRKKVAFISVHASPLAILGGVDSGGQNVYVGELARELITLGFEIDIFTRRDREGLPEVVRWMPGIRIIHVDAGPAMGIAKEQLLPFISDFKNNMLGFIKKHHLYYTLIHANFFMSAMVADALKIIMGIPYVVTFHALGQVRRKYQRDKDKFPLERMIIEEQSIKNADCIIAECPQDKEDLINYYAAPPNKIMIIPCGFNPKEFYPVERKYARRVLHIPAHAKIVLQLGRMVPRKGVDNVIRGVGRLKKRKTEVKLIVVGGPADVAIPEKDPEIERLMQIATEEGIKNRVFFTGRKDREHLKYYYSAADVFVTTPWYEPFGITPLEAMACGTPVIGSNVGGIKYSIQDHKTGFLVPPNAPGILSDQLNELLMDNLLCEKISKEALRRVNAFFTWTEIARHVSRLYEEVGYRYHAPITAS